MKGFGMETKQKTPEQMAEEFAEHFTGERRKTIAKKSWWTGYQAGRLNSEGISSTQSIGVQAAKPQWISVKERLPKPDQEILVVTTPPKREISHVYWDAMRYVFERMEYGHLKPNEISHWIPLPEAPKG